MKVLGVAAALLWFSTAQAVEIGGNLRLGFDFGGEKLATVKYSDGSASDLKVATFMTLGLGATLIPLRHDIHALQLDASVAFAGWNTGPDTGKSNDSLSLNRFPLELIASYRIDLGPFVSLRAGAGIAYHLVTGVNGSGSLKHIQLDVGNALGAVGELSVLYRILGFHLRYTSMKYTFVATGAEMDASSVGLAMTLFFPAAGSSARPPQIDLAEGQK